MKTRSRDFKTSLILLVLSALLFYGSFFTKKMVAMSAGPEFMPRLLSALMLLFGIIMMVKSQVGVNATPPAAAETSRKSEKSSLKQLVFDKYSHYTLWICMLIYAFSMQRLGFILSSVFLIFASTWLMAPKHERRPAVFAVIAVLIPTGIYFLFTKVFLLMLPEGILG